VPEGVEEIKRRTGWDKDDCWTPPPYYDGIKAAFRLY
jgi:hypothetical protein